MPSHGWPSRIEMTGGNGVLIQRPGPRDVPSKLWMLLLTLMPSTSSPVPSGVPKTVCSIVSPSPGRSTMTTWLLSVSLGPW
jgi:hypothetical protein